MQLKTVKEVVFEHYKTSFNPNISKDQNLIKAITQDRADIRAVLREGVEALASKTPWKAGGVPHVSADDILTLIDNTLLPGDVSK